MAADAPAQHVDRRSEILRGAIRLFRLNGYHGTGINDLGAEVGLTGPAIYRHFDSKADVLVAAIVEGGARIAEAAAAADDAAEDPVTTLRALIESYVDVAVTDPDLLAVYLLEARHLPEDRRSVLDRRSNSYIRQFTRLLEEIEAPAARRRDAAALVQAVLLMPGTFCLGLSEPNPEIVDLLVERMLLALVGSTASTSAVPATSSRARRA